MANEIKQMVVHEDPDFASEAAKAIARACGTAEASVVKASNFQQAQDCLDRKDWDWSLIVVGTSAPASPTSGTICGCSEVAREFMRTLRLKRATPLIALSAVDDPLVEELLKCFPDTALVKANLRSLEENARALRDKTAVESSLELEITLKDDQEGIWRIKRSGSKSFSDTGPLKFDAAVVKDLINYSYAVGGYDGDRWRDTLKDIAEKLERMLFDWHNRRLVQVFFGNLEAVGIENSQIFFTMKSQRQQAMVEALRENPDARMQDFWMLKTPIVRQYESSGGQRPLFTDRQSRDEKLNCLIVNADPAAGVLKNTPWNEKCDALDHIESEAGDIVTCLEQARGRGAGIKLIEPLDLSLDPADAAGALLRKLKERTWHIVHFAGHGVLGKDKDGNRIPGLVLSAPSGVVMRFSTLAVALKDTQFLFLSSCRTASPEFITKAIEYQVPMVIGYQWKVDDVEASAFARTFYERLFDGRQPTSRSIYRALVASRQSAFAREPEGTTWASPVLLTQPNHEHFD